MSVNAYTRKRRDALWLQINRHRMRNVRPVCNDQLESLAERDRREWIEALKVIGPIIAITAAIAFASLLLAFW